MPVTRNRSQSRSRGRNPDQAIHEDDLPDPEDGGQDERIGNLLDMMQAMMGNMMQMMSGMSGMGGMPDTTLPINTVFT